MASCTRATTLMRALVRFAAPRATCPQVRTALYQYYTLYTIQYTLYTTHLHCIVHVSVDDEC
jgi:hypothetical protein